MYKIKANENVIKFLFHCNGRFIASIYTLAVGRRMEYHCSVMSSQNIIRG